MTDTTSNGGKPFSDRVQQHLANLKSSVERAQTQIEAANSKTAVDLQKMREQAHAAAEVQRAKVEAANARMKASVDAKKAETDATIAGWKAKNEARRLGKRAEDAEAHAIESLYDARVGIERAIEAVIDAAIARLDADDASKEAHDKEAAPADAPKS